MVFEYAEILFSWFENETATFGKQNLFTSLDYVCNYLNFTCCKQNIGLLTRHVNGMAYDH
jgi:hypothetical protein